MLTEFQTCAENSIPPLNFVCRVYGLWSASLLFTYGINRFYHDMAQITKEWLLQKNCLQRFNFNYVANIHLVNNLYNYISIKIELKLLIDIII